MSIIKQILGIWPEYLRLTSEEIERRQRTKSCWINEKYKIRRKKRRDKETDLNLDLSKENVNSQKELNPRLPGGHMLESSLNVSFMEVVQVNKSDTEFDLISD
ncbi:hypothetical protein BpHYR1_046075 [Brachionus plicatilis]|uniref:Uncharacterized protein n=1 Tax=Brachionus plicatilis TaxID=10195 RepID=A0A3M7S8F1_BRAPC|nr:hypothetical protein BpHYR1_046075 [Brachionus plicatilis]